MSKSWTGFIHIESIEGSENFGVRSKFKDMNPKDAVNIVASIFSALNIPMNTIPTITQLAMLELAKRSGDDIDSLIEIDIEGLIKQLADAKFEEWMNNHE